MSGLSSRSCKSFILIRMIFIIHICGETKFNFTLENFTFTLQKFCKKLIILATRGVMVYLNISSKVINRYWLKVYSHFDLSNN